LNNEPAHWLNFSTAGKLSSGRATGACGSTNHGGDKSLSTNRLPCSSTTPAGRLVRVQQQLLTQFNVENNLK